MKTILKAIVLGAVIVAYITGGSFVFGEVLPDDWHRQWYASPVIIGTIFGFFATAAVGFAALKLDGK